MQLQFQPTHFCSTEPSCDCSLLATAVASVLFQSSIECNSIFSHHMSAALSEAETAATSTWQQPRELFQCRRCNSPRISTVDAADVLTCLCCNASDCGAIHEGAAKRESEIAVLVCCIRAKFSR